MNEERALRVVHEEIVAPGAPWSARVRRDQVLRIVDLEGEQGVDFLCYDATDPRERYYAPNTIKKSGTLRLTKISSWAMRSTRTGDDRSSRLWPTPAVITTPSAGCCSAPSNAMLYAVEGVPGCRENFLAALAEHGLGWTDIVPNVNFFCAVPVYEVGRLAERTFVSGPSKPGDHIDLRAERDVLAIVSNCPQVNNPAAGGRPTPIRVQILESGVVRRAGSTSTDVSTS